MAGRFCLEAPDETLYIAPGSPWENGYAESFHSRLRDEFLATKDFESLAAARKLTAAWREDYNMRRPHGALRPAEGGDPLVPADVYAGGRTIQIPHRQSCARAAQTKVDQLLEEAA